MPEWNETTTVLKLEIFWWLAAISLTTQKGSIKSVPNVPAFLNNRAFPGYGVYTHVYASVCGCVHVRARLPEGAVAPGQVRAVDGPHREQHWEW